MIYSKIDNLTYMFYDKSCKWVMEKFNLWDISYSFNHQIMSNVQGMTKVRALDYAGVLMFVSNDFYNFPKDAMPDMDKFDLHNYESSKRSFYHETCKTIRVEFQGQGMQTMLARDKANGTDIVKKMYDPTYFGVYLQDYRVKRCDFAFDFVNYKPRFIDELLGWCFENNIRLITQRCICGNLGGYALEYKGGNQKCVYIGSTKSKKYLRIYDKLLKECPRGVWNTTPPSEFDRETEEITSWFRFELQTRDKSPGGGLPAEYLYNCGGDLSKILREIFDTFTLRDFDSHEVLPFIQDLYNWDELPRIIQNTNYGYYKELMPSVVDYLERVAAKSTFTHIAYTGFFNHVKFFANAFKAMQFTDDTSMLNRKHRVFNQLDILCDDLNIVDHDYSKLPGITFNHDLSCFELDLVKLYEDLSVYLSEEGKL